MSLLHINDLPQSNFHDNEFERVRSELMTMGGIVARQIQDAIHALQQSDIELARRLINVEEQVDNMDLMISEHCTRILLRHSALASDLRLIVAVSRAVLDLERMGNEAKRIATQVISLIEKADSFRGKQEVNYFGVLVQTMLEETLDAFARNDTNLAYRVVKRGKTLDQEYNTALDLLMHYMEEDPEIISGTHKIIWILRSLESIGDNARIIAQHLIYMVTNTDVRHAPISHIKDVVAEDKS